MDLERTYILRAFACSDFTSHGGGQGRHKVHTDTRQNLIRRARQNKMKKKSNTNIKAGAPS